MFFYTERDVYFQIIFIIIHTIMHLEVRLLQFLLYIFEKINVIISFSFFLHVCTCMFQFQVSPGMRANNYYDNFRSFSRQNRFSTPPTTSGAGNGGRRQAESLPANNTASGYNRTRKKYKINREQNRQRKVTIFFALLKI